MDVLRTLAKQALDGQSLDEGKSARPTTLRRRRQRFSGVPRLDALCRMGSIDTMLASFIEPLQKLADDKSRVHCSLNLNTETAGYRRGAQLQNQPLEKDRYKIRDAFTCEPGNSLIVADYGQRSCGAGRTSPTAGP